MLGLNVQRRRKPKRTRHNANPRCMILESIGDLNTLVLCHPIVVMSDAISGPTMCARLNGGPTHGFGFNFLM